MGRELPRRTYSVTFKGELEGFHATMGALRGRELIRMLRGEMQPEELIELIAERTVDSDFGVDIRDLEAWMYEAIVDGWTTAISEVSLPPVSGESSATASATSPTTPTGRTRSRKRT